ncbi:BTAD domain-containing putative transcriptional regulator [Saccharopolyspora soli]|uniref:BTAD domain-containing putative transcriptional regulator n=1 Tax=Saccharopolyspora soli TaxID=2926618 RepID=UPI003556BCD9
MRGQQAQWEQLRLTVAEERLAAEIEPGRHVELFAKLRLTMTAQSHRQRLGKRSIFALYRYSH